MGGSEKERRIEKKLRFECPRIEPGTSHMLGKESVAAHQGASTCQPFRACR